MIFLIVGWLDLNVFKAMQEESKFGFDKHPRFTEMYNKINRIEASLDKNEKKGNKDE